MESIPNRTSYRTNFLWSWDEAGQDQKSGSVHVKLAEENVEEVKLVLS